MIEYKTEIEDQIKDEPNLLLGTKVTIVREYATDSEIKIENEAIRLDDHKETVDNLLISDWKRCTDTSVLNSEKTHPCTFCNSSFIDKNDYRKHLRKIHGTFRCEVDECGKEFNNIGKLKYHQKIRHDPPQHREKPFKCDFENCDFETYISSTLKYHTLRHFDKSHICHFCHKSFFQVSQLKKHLLTHTVREYATDSEIKIENEAIRLDDHKENVDDLLISDWKRCTDTSVLNSEKTHPCTSCNSSFIDKNDYRKHLRKIHGTFRCEVDECGKEFNNIGKLKYHQKIRHDPPPHQEKTFKCDFENCDFESHILSTLKYHTLRHFDKSHICHFCQKSFFQVSQLKKHLLTHTGETPYACDKCPKAFKTSVALQAHYKRLHIGEKQYFCDLCDKDIYTTDFLKHERTIHGTFRCEVDGCAEVFDKKGKLIYHKKICHDPQQHREKTFECNFENCDFKSKTSVSLQRHTLRHFDKSHICNLCPKAFYSSADLKQHLYTHTGERPYACDICPKAYTKSTLLRNHKYSHIGVKPYSCKFCEKEFTNRTNKRHHERSHTNERAYACTVCQKTFVSNNGLYTHKITHSGKKRYQCKVCQRSFGQSNHLVQHERMHTGEKPYCCDVCDHRFAQIGHLRTHLKTHSRGKPFSCSTCESTFSFKSQLTAHERIHSGDTVFICDLCDKVYVEKRSIRVHLQKCYNRTYKSTSDIRQGNVILRITRLPQKKC